MIEQGTLLVNGSPSPAEIDENGIIFSGPDVSRRAAPRYPEHDKLQTVKESSQAIGEFLDWLQNEQAVVLAKEHQHSEDCYQDGDRVCGVQRDELAAVIAPIHCWLARYFDIDEEKLESEKRQMLDEMRSAASAG
jgi:hypothetical protein